MLGVGLRFRNPDVPVGDKVEVFMKTETLPKMKKLLSIVGGKILLEEKKDGYIHMIIQKTSAKDPDKR